MSGDFGIVERKFDRAKFHADDFLNKWTHFVQGGAYGYTFEMDLEPPHVVHFRWKVFAQPADIDRITNELSLVYGDLLANLRSTLDFLVWQLVLANNGLTTNNHAFPCVKDSTNWGSARGSRLVDVATTWVDEIEKLQAYHGGNQPERHLLAVLDEVNNLNKHRTLPPTIITAEKFAVGISSPEMPGRTLHRILDVDAPIKDGDEFFSFWWDPPIKDSLSINPKADPPIRISFDDGLDHSDGWGYANDDLVDWVADAIAIFKPAFPS